MSMASTLSQALLNITPNNVDRVDFDELLNTVAHISLVEIPDPIDENMGEIIGLIQYFANVYSYLIALYARCNYLSAVKKHDGNSDEATLLIRRKDALYEIARGVRYKQEACSRLLTGKMASDEVGHWDRPDIQGRESNIKSWANESTKDNIKTRARKVSWDNVD